MFFSNYISLTGCIEPVQCGPFERETDCGSMCQETCAQILELEEPKMCPMVCLPNMCECIPGYVRISQDDWMCVPRDICCDIFGK